jgi:hypothetical protein
VALAAGDAERAARLFGAAEVLRQAIGAPIHPAESAVYDGSIQATRARLDERVFHADWEAGRAMSLEQAISYALQDGSDEAPPEPNDT